ncbi:hypothetical protein A2U01_0057360, partial [Trifolium medium]|nr:hypothetical protein [Trifolium medium]
YTVDYFGLSIGFRVVGSAHPKFGATESEEFFPEFANEQRVSVGDKASWDTMQFASGIEKYGRHSMSSIIWRKRC